MTGKEATATATVRMSNLHRSVHDTQPISGATRNRDSWNGNRQDGQYTYWRDIEALLCNYYCSGKARIIKYSESVFVALGILHVTHMRNFVFNGLYGSTFSPDCFINGMIFGKYY